MIRLTILLAVFGCLAGCKPKPLDGGQEIAQEAELRKVKRITQEQIFSQAYLVGDSITAQEQRELRQQLKVMLQKNDFAGAIQVCRSAGNLGPDSLQKEYEAAVSRTSQRLRNPANAASGKAVEILDAYHYNAENKLQQDPNIQLLADENVLYTKPIVISDQLCLRCHGVPLQDIGAADWATLQAAYPADKATGYAIGDLRGMWMVKLPRPELIKGVAAQTKKRKKPNA